MSIRARLAKLERQAPGAQGRLITLEKLDGESPEDVYSAYPDIEPGRHDLVVMVNKFRPRQGERQPAVITPVVG